MYDEIFDGFVQPPEKLGFILAHELGHSFYGRTTSMSTTKTTRACCTVRASASTRPKARAHGGTLRGAWCDDSKSPRNQPDWPDYSNPVVANYRCWDQAQSVHVDLEHTGRLLR